MTLLIEIPVTCKLEKEYAKINEKYIVSCKLSRVDEGL